MKTGVIEEDKAHPGIKFAQFNEGEQMRTFLCF
jgi:hypothetical protein